MTATIRGGAVRIAACPNRVPNTDGVPVRELDKGVSGVVGVRALIFDIEPADPCAVVTFNDWRRGVLAPAWREESDEVVRRRAGTGGVSPKGLGGTSSEGEATTA